MERSGEFGPAGALRRVGEAALVGTGLAALYHFTGLGVPCPLRLWTGLWCPACGGTRMAAAMLSGHVTEAFWWNPFAFVVCAGVALCSAWWALELIGAPPWRPFRRFGGMSQTRVYWVLGVVAVVFTVVRNIPHWPPHFA